MNKILTTLALGMLLACASQKTTSTSSATQTNNSTKPVEFLDDNTFLLTEMSDDRSYGYSKSNPIKVGGIKEQSGPRNERRFLNALLGPNGEKVSYFRAGSCCPFKTRNGLIDNTGMLDRYRVSWVGAKDTVDIYINMYDAGELKVPVGFTATKGRTD